MKSKVQTTDDLHKKNYFLNTRILPIILGAVILFCFIAPYIHIFLDKSAKIKWFGFRNLRSFFYAFGLPLSLFACSSMFLFALNYQRDLKFKLYFTIIALLFNYSSIFHFFWIFWIRTPDFSKIQYYMSIVVISGVFTYVYYMFYKHYKSTIYKLQKALNSISRAYFTERLERKIDSNTNEIKSLISRRKKKGLPLKFPSKYIVKSNDESVSN